MQGFSLLFSSLGTARKVLVSRAAKVFEKSREKVERSAAVLSSCPPHYLCFGNGRDLITANFAVLNSLTDGTPNDRPQMPALSRTNKRCPTTDRSARQARPRRRNGENVGFTAGPRQTPDFCPPLRTAPGCRTYFPEGRRGQEKQSRDTDEQRSTERTQRSAFL